MAGHVEQRRPDLAGEEKLESFAATSKAELASCRMPEQRLFDVGKGEPCPWIGKLKDRAARRGRPRETVCIGEWRWCMEPV